MELTTEETDNVDEKAGLKGYTKSHYFVIGIRLFWSGRADKAIDSFKRGAENNGCVGCMSFCSMTHHRDKNFHLIVPLAFESAIRGHIPSIILLVDCYRTAKPAPAYALVGFWRKTMNELTDFEDKRSEIQKECYDNIDERKRKKTKKDILNHCFICSKEDSKERTFNKCGRCKQYSYCGKECQSRHWKKMEGNHMAECRQFMILKEYFNPRYAREIRDAIIAGDDPKTIVRLQTLRNQLGLTRPKEDYEELLMCLNDNNNNTTNSNRLDPYTYLVARKDGTVHIGSTPNII